MCSNFNIFLNSKIIFLVSVSYTSESIFITLYLCPFHLNLNSSLSTVAFDDDNSNVTNLKNIFQSILSGSQT